MISREKYEKLMTNSSRGHCHFCDLETQVVLGVSTHWIWIANLSPYWRYHTLLIPKIHKSKLNDTTQDELLDFMAFYPKIVRHLLDLNLKHKDGKPMDQFILMIRERYDNISGSTYYKPDHLHIHLAPDKEGVERFVLDESAINIDIEKLRLPPDRDPSITSTGSGQVNSGQAGQL